MADAPLNVSAVNPSGAPDPALPPTFAGNPAAGAGVPAGIAAAPAESAELTLPGDATAAAPARNCPICAGPVLPGAPHEACRRVHLQRKAQALHAPRPVAPQAASPAAPVPVVYPPQTVEHEYDMGNGVRRHVRLVAEDVWIPPAPPAPPPPPPPPVAPAPPPPPLVLQEAAPSGRMPCPDCSACPYRPAPRRFARSRKVAGWGACVSAAAVLLAWLLGGFVQVQLRPVPVDRWHAAPAPQATSSRELLERWRAQGRLTGSQRAEAEAAIRADGGTP